MYYRVLYEAIQVSRYIKKYHRLPPHYITKRKASLGRKKGSLNLAQSGKMIGGDIFHNRQKLLPPGHYRECDLGTYGKTSRGACRLVFSNNDDFYVTFDHYASFVRIIV